MDRDLIPVVRRLNHGLLAVRQSHGQARGQRDVFAGGTLAVGTVVVVVDKLQILWYRRGHDRRAGTAGRRWRGDDEGTATSAAAKLDIWMGKRFRLGTSASVQSAAR